MVIGSFQYLAFTRPDIATDIHWQATKRILRYLAGTLTHGILFRPNSPLSLHAFSDADWAGDTDDFVSTNGYIVYLVTLQYHSPPKNKNVSRDRQRMLNIVMWRTPHLSYVGSPLFSRN